MIQWCLNVGPPSLTSARHQNNIASTSRVCPGINTGSRPDTATLTKCWASGVDGVPALKQHWLHVIVQWYVCLLGQSVPDAYATTLS